METWRRYFNRSAIAAHREWQERGGTGEGRYEVADADLTDAQIPGEDAKGVIFRNCVFRKANLWMSFFNAAIFENCLFEDSEMEAVNFSGATLQGCRFKDCHMVASIWKQSKLIDCVFAGETSLAMSGWGGATAEGADFRCISLIKTDFPDAYFHACDFTGARFLEADFSKGDFRRCDFRLADFMDAKLSQGHFYECGFWNSTRKPASAPASCFVRCDMSEVFNGSDLRPGKEVAASLLSGPEKPRPPTSPGSAPEGR